MTIALIALSEICGLGESRMVATGEHEADGTPRLRCESVAIQPGTAITVEKAEAERLIRTRAAAAAGSEEAAHAIRKARESQK
jgi:hypothetical protein